MWNYLKNVFLSGLIILIPLVLLYVTFRELLDLMIGLATPIAEMLPEGWIREDDWIPAVAAILIVLSAFAIGLLWSLPLTRTATRWLESQTLNRVPMYRMLKSLVAAFLDIETKESFQPALWRHDDGSREPVYIIEPHGEDMLVVMQPWTPTPFAGSVRVVPLDQVSPVGVSLDEFSLALTHFGLGLSDTLRHQGEARRRG